MIRRPQSNRLRAALAAAAAFVAIHASCAAAPAAKIELRFVAQTAPPELGMLVMATDENRSDPFTLPLRHLSDPQTAPARAFRLELAEKPTVLASVTLPATGNAFVILLVPALKAGFEPVVIPAADGSFRPGDFYLHNVSRLPVLGRVGTTEFTIAPRTGRVVRPAGAREGRFYDVLLGVREDAGSRIISSSRWPTSNHNRTYVFFFDNPQRNDIDFRAVDEFVPPRPMAGAGGATSR